MEVTKHNIDMWKRTKLSIVVFKKKIIADLKIVTTMKNTEDDGIYFYVI